MSLFGFTRATPDTELYNTLGRYKHDRPDADSSYFGAHSDYVHTAPNPTRKFDAPTGAAIKNERNVKSMKPGTEQRAYLRRAYNVGRQERLIQEINEPPADAREGRYTALAALQKQYVKHAAREEVECLDEMVDKGFADEFRAFLVAQGPRRNMDTYQSGERDAPELYRKQPVSTHPTVIEFLDKHVDAEQEFKTDLAKLIARYEKTGSLANASLQECWMYYKFVIQGMNPTQMDYDRWSTNKNAMADNLERGHYRVAPQTDPQHYAAPPAPLIGDAPPRALERIIRRGVAPPVDLMD